MSATSTNIISPTACWQSTCRPNEREQREQATSDLDRITLPDVQQDVQYIPDSWLDTNFNLSGMVKMIGKSSALISNHYSLITYRCLIASRTFLIGLALLPTPGLAETARAQGPVVLTDERHEYPLGLHLEILKDPTRQLTIDEVSSPEFEAHFRPCEAKVPNFGYTRSAYWVRFRVRNEALTAAEWLLELGFANMHYVDLFRPLPDHSGFATIQTGVYRPVSTREFAHPLFVFSMPLPSHTVQTIYLRFENGASMTIPLTIWSRQAFSEKSRLGHLGLGLFYGILLVMLGYNLFLFLSTRDKSYLYLALYLAMATLGSASYDGLAPLYFWRNQIGITRLALLLPYGVMACSFLKFTQSFLETRSLSPRLHRYLNVLLTIWGLLLLLTLVMPYGYVIRPVNIFWVLTLLGSWVVGFIFWERGYRPARYYVLSGLGLLVGFLVLMLIRFAVIPPLLLAELNFKVGMIWHVMLLSLALADQINLLKTDTERANLNLQKNEEKYRTLFESSRDAIFITTPEGEFVDFNQAGLDLVGYSRDELKAMNVIALYVDPKVRKEYQGQMTQKGYVREFEVQTKRKDGQVIDCHITSTARRRADGHIIAYDNIVRDVTEQKRALQEIRNSRERVRALAAHMNTIAEQERIAVARDVHDELGGVLTSLKIDLTLLEDKIQEDGEDAGHDAYLKEVRSMQSVIDTTINNVRKLVRKLRPEVLDSLGLIAGLEWQLEEFHKRTGVACDFQSGLDELDLNETSSIAVFRIFQEALTNIARHAQATRVNVSISKNEKNATFQIADDGVGISEDRRENTSSFGLLGMRERTLMLGGEMEINSLPGQGTAITIKIPVRPGVPG